MLQGANSLRGRNSPGLLIREDWCLPFHSLEILLNCMRYKCAISWQGASGGLLASEIRIEYSNSWWLIDTQDTGCMSKFAIQSNVASQYIFPQVTIACVFAHFAIQDRVREVPKGLNFGGNIKGMERLYCSWPLRALRSHHWYLE